MAKFKTTSNDPDRHDSLEPRRVTYKPGEPIFQEGDLGLAMYVIAAGVVEIRKKVGDEDQVLATLEKGDFFGEMCLLEDDLPRTATAVASEETSLVIIDHAAFNHILERNPEIAVRMMRKLARRLRETTARLEAVGGPSVEWHESGITESRAERKDHSARLVDRGTGVEYPLSAEKETTVGRIDPVTGIQPDIDFTAADQKRSISRRHAKIRREHDGDFVVIEDVGTMNGTYVNGERIITGRPTAIEHGDVVRFGAVECQFVVED